MPEEASSSNQPTKKKPLTRREALRKELKMAETEEFEMPPCDAPFIVGYLFEIGPTLTTSMGEGPVSHTEIEAFQRNTGIQFDSWTARTVHQLSGIYLTESHKATDRNHPPPWDGADYARRAASIIAGQRMREETRALAKL